MKNYTTKHIKKLAKNTDEVLALCKEFMYSQPALQTFHPEAAIISCPCNNLFFETDNSFMFEKVLFFDVQETYVVNDYEFVRTHYQAGANWTTFMREKLREISPEAEEEYVQDFIDLREEEKKTFTDNFDKITNLMIGNNIEEKTFDK